MAFCASINTASARGDMARRVPDHAAFFAVLDKQCAGIHEITQQRLLDLFGAEGMRRADLPVRFLASHLTLAWDAKAGMADSDRRRMDATSAAARNQPWGADLTAYRKHLSAGRAIASETARMYVAAAAGLLRGTGVRTASDLTQAHVSRYLLRHRGRRTNIIRFLSWVSGLSGVPFDVGAGQRMPPRKREQATLRKAADLLTRLEATRDKREGQALLAAAIGVVHGVTLTRVLMLRRDQVEVDGSRTVLWPGEHDIELARPLSSAFAGVTARNGRLAFPGRNGVQPLTASAVRHHLRGLTGKSIATAPVHDSVVVATELSTTTRHRAHR